MAGIDGFGTELARGDGESPEVFSAIANVTNIDGPELTRETLDVTAHDSPDEYMEFLGGLKDSGEVSLDVNYDPAEHDTLVTDFASTDPINYTLTFPEGTEWAFAAIMTGFKPSAPYDDKLAAEIKFKVTGKPTITPAA
ncbi:MAG: phage tail tube protein [Pseudonocardiaceae bacterium]